MTQLYAHLYVLASPPLDLDLQKLNQARLRCIVSAMQINPGFDAWLGKKRRYERDREVRTNVSQR